MADLYFPFSEQLVGNRGRIERQHDQITALRTLVADLLEWADHQSCAIEDGLPCDCGYDALAQQWEELRD